MHTGTSQAGKQSAYEISPWEDLIVKGLYTHTLLTHMYAMAAQPLPGVSFHFLSHDQSNLAFI